MDNTTATILSFVLITFFFSIIRFVLAGTPSEKVFTIIYFLLIIIMQYSVNSANLQDRCGNIPHTTALYFTIIPWLFIFGLLYVCLIIFPLKKVSVFDFKLHELIIKNKNKICDI